MAHLQAHLSNQSLKQTIKDQVFGKILSTIGKAGDP